MVIIVVVIVVETFHHKMVVVMVRVMICIWSLLVKFLFPELLSKTMSNNVRACSVRHQSHFNIVEKAS